MKKSLPIIIFYDNDSAGSAKLELPALTIIYDMISGMSRADVKNVLLIMHTDSVF